MARAVARPTRRRINWRTQGVAYMFLLPAIVLFFLFAWTPIIQNVIFSVHDVRLGTDSPFVGLQNYERMLADPVFGKAWSNAVQFTLISLLIGFAFPIVVAMGVNEMRRAKGFFRLVYSLPGVIPGVVSLLIWQQMYSADNGVINELINAAGGPTIAFLTNPAIQKWAMVIIMTWGGFGGSVLVYIAALQDVPAELYEASEIDGAGPWQRVMHITFPHLRNLMSVFFLLQILGVMQIFTEPFILTQGNPNNATMTPVLYIYNRAFVDRQYGVASAWSMVLMVVLFIMSIIYLRVSRLGRSQEN